MTPVPQLGNALFTAEEIRQRVHALADQIARDYGEEEFIVVAVMKGSFMFLADLIRCLSVRRVHPKVDFITLSSYGARTTSCLQVTVQCEGLLPVAGRRILLVDDILDTGLTLQTASKLLTDQGASDIRICVLLDKPSRRMAPVASHYTGFEVDNVFVVGYGLDHDNRYRDLPGLATLEFRPPS
jgi:hypoxanthine phosphoribosyltransferase